MASNNARFDAQSAAEKAVSVIGLGYDLTSDIRLSACKSTPDGSSLLKIDPTGNRDLPNRDDCSARAVWLLASAARPLAKVVTSRVGVSRGADAEPTAPSLMGSKNRRLVVDFDGSARNCPKKRTSAIRYKSSGLMPNNGLSKPGI
ncbi:Uncharacterized protein Rs2_02312 [Raphanus sativus]|nr:Uncharacterized protein Rs2_02312 [Raphanus sativus]